MLFRWIAQEGCPSRYDGRDLLMLYIETHSMNCDPFANHLAVSLLFLLPEPDQPWRMRGLASPAFFEQYTLQMPFYRLRMTRYVLFSVGSLVLVSF